jgi:hypothetical protein
MCRVGCISPTLYPALEADSSRHSPMWEVRPIRAESLEVGV